MTHDTKNIMVILSSPSGVGKTTLLSILCGIQKPTTGKISYNSIDLYNLPENKIDELSIGMSDDYEKALKFNPSYIRLGTILFGKRL